MAVGRNAPCPCGSGKKYKKCCLKSGPDPISYTKEKLDRFHEKLVGELFRHGEQIFGFESLDEAAEEFFCWPLEEDADGIDLENHEMVFYPWFLFKWQLDPDEESCLPGPPGAEYRAILSEGAGTEPGPPGEGVPGGIGPCALQFF